jgi:small multidrug resistance pump
MSSFLLLGLAIAAEVAATMALKASDGFARPWPGLAALVGYGAAFYCMSLAMRTLAVGVIYAIWSGIGIVLIGLLGWYLWDERLDRPAILGIGLILAGVLVINVFSDTVRH